MKLKFKGRGMNERYKFGILMCACRIVLGTIGKDEATEGLTVSGEEKRPETQLWNVGIFRDQKQEEEPAK